MDAGSKAGLCSAHETGLVNELLALGLELRDVISMVTSHAATMLGLDGRLHRADSPLLFESAGTVR